MAETKTCTSCGTAFCKANTEFCDSCLPGVRLEKKRLYAKNKRKEAGLPLLGAPMACGICGASTPRLNNGQKYCLECGLTEKARLTALSRERHKGKYPRTIENPDVVRRRKREWAERNPEKVKASRLRHDVVRLSSPRWRMENAVRCGIRRGLRPGSKGDMRTFDLVGYSPDELRDHLERQFLPGMSWDNYGDWHVDHRLPLSSFDYSEPSGPEFAAAWALTNLQPMWANDNLKKSSKVLYLL